MGRYTTRQLNNSQYKELIETVREGYADNEGIKHRPNIQLATILVLEANLGCRIGDILKLTTDSIIHDGSMYKLNIVEQKTGKRRCFIVPKPIKDFIDKYTEANGITSGKLFDITGQAVWKHLRAVTDYLGLENTSTHSLRKMCASNLYESTGHDIEAVCEFLNHSSTTVTRHYIRRTDAQLETAIENNVNLV